MSKERVNRLNEELNGLSPVDILAAVLKEFGDKVVLASSLGAEDQVLTQMAITADSRARIFVLDTGRLNPETYDVLAKSKDKYDIDYEVYFPKTDDVEAMVRQSGINLFYESVENRKTCCGVRKVEPLKRALSTADAWITGLRRSQAVTRAELPIVEWDDAHNMIKINPLADWSEDDVWTYIKDNDIPYNKLHDQGYPSIGCAPCTRVVKEGEDVRAGRWWWESPESKECGLHIKDGKIMRKDA